ncbi:MAG: radical SAM protein [Peptostreptococcaceae bacterium]
MIAYEVISNKSCNLGCYFCFAKSNISKDCDFLSQEDFDAGLQIALDKCARFNDNNLLVKIYGGEPLLKTEVINGYLKHLYTIAKSTPDVNLFVTIITNGTIIKDSFLDSVKMLDCMNNVTLTVAFSLEANKNTHDKIRRFKHNDSSTFDLVIQNIEKYKNVTGKFPKIQTALTPELLDDVDGYIELMETNKTLGTFEINPFFDDTDVCVTDTQLNNMSILFDYYIDKFLHSDHKHIGMYQAFRIQFNRYNKDPQGHCNAGVKKMNILPNGDITPCFRFNVSGVNNNAYGHCASSETYNSILSKEHYYSKVQTPYNEICKSCQTKNDIGCLGKCLAVALAGEHLHVGYDNNMCKYHIRFGKECNRLFDEVCETLGFKDKIKAYTKGRKLPDDIIHMWGK